jgi:hypothetical protein
MSWLLLQRLRLKAKATTRGVSYSRITPLLQRHGPLHNVALYIVLSALIGINAEYLTPVCFLLLRPLDGHDGCCTEWRVGIFFFWRLLDLGGREHPLG